MGWITGAARALKLLGGVALAAGLVVLVAVQMLILPGVALLSIFGLL